MDSGFERFIPVATAQARPCARCGIVVIYIVHEQAAAADACYKDRFIDHIQFLKDLANQLCDSAVHTAGAEARDLVLTERCGSCVISFP